MPQIPACANVENLFKIFHQRLLTGFIPSLYYYLPLVCKVKQWKTILSPIILRLRLNAIACNRGKTTQTNSKNIKGAFFTCPHSIPIALEWGQECQKLRK